MRIRFIRLRLYKRCSLIRTGAPCGSKCVAMPTARESVCCLEISDIEDKMSELQTLDPS